MSLPEIAGHELQDLIGSGCCGAVYRARAMDGSVCAVKVFSAMAINRKGLAMAMEAVCGMEPHPGVLMPRAFGMDHGPYFCATPLLGGMVKDSNGRQRWRVETLEDLLQAGVNAAERWPLVYELADAMAWLHRSGIPHGNLRPCNVLLDGRGENRLRLSDVAQGWVGGVHHLELGDHFVYLCPEQAEMPDGVFSGYGQGWDVYSFGVVAYRILTGRLPRADAAWNAQVERARRQVEVGLAYQIDSLGLLQAVRSEPEVQWPGAAADKWEERRRGIIERALSLNAAERWRDMREVMREFEVLEADFLLEQSRAETVAERVKQKKLVSGLRLKVAVLGLSLLAALGYGVITWMRAVGAETELAESEARHLEDVEQREARAAAEVAKREASLSELTLQRDSALTAKATSDSNLRHAQAAVDQFLTQLLQTPVSNDLEVEFSRKQLDDALEFTKHSLEDLEGQPELGVERARAYGNLGRIYLRLKQEEPAREYLQKAIDEAVPLLAANQEPKMALTLHQMIGRYGLWLADWHHRQGDGEKSRVLLEEAVGHLQEGLAADEGSRLARVQCARACVELGIRSYEKGVLDGAEKALLKAQEVLGMEDGTDESSEGANLGDEAFLFARSEFALGQVLRERGDLQGALERMINSVQTMGELLMDSSPRNQDHALALAESYTILAELVGQHFNAKDSLEAHEQAIPILLELNRLLPEWAEVKYLLARNHGAMAQIERDLGKGTEAVRKKQGAIELINEVLADYPENERYLLLLGRLRSEYAGFLADGRKPSDALAMSKVAAETLRELVEKSGELVKGRVSPEQRERRVQLAQLHGVQGHSYQLMGQKTQAREAFEGAKALWQGLAEAAVPDDMVKQGLAYVEDKLAKLK